MAEPIRTRAILGLLVALASAPFGCAFVPRSQLEECRRYSRTLQAETARLKDTNLALQSRNRDLADRATDDARRVAGLEETNRRYEQSILAYQKERDRLADDFDRIQADLRAASPPRQASRD